MTTPHAPKPYEQRRQPAIRALPLVARRPCLDCADGVLRGKRDGAIWARVCDCGRVACLAAPSERERSEMFESREDAAE